jgi:Mn-containing catalase
MNPQHAIVTGLGAAPRDSMGNPWNANYIVSSGRNQDIAKEMNITEGTVKAYLHRVYEKLGVGNRTELALLAAAERAGSR